MSGIEQPSDPRERWKQADPEVRDMLAEIAFRPNSGFTQELQAHIHGNVIEDLREKIDQGESND